MNGADVPLLPAIEGRRHIARLDAPERYNLMWITAIRFLFEINGFHPQARR